MDNDLRKRLVHSQVPGFIGTVLIFLGIYSLVNTGQSIHTILDDKRVSYLLLGVGGVLWLLSFAGIVSSIKATMKLAKLHKSGKTDSGIETESVIRRGKTSSNIVIYILIIAFVGAFIFENIDHVRNVDEPVTNVEIPVQKEIITQPIPEAKLVTTNGQFYQAVAKNDFETVLHLQKSLKPSEINSIVGGMTPVMKATSIGNIMLVRFLLENGADPNKRGSQNRTALQYAAERNRIEVAKLLLKYGADINGTDNSRLSPLTMAADRRHHDFAILLIDKGADVNIQHAQGWTALIDAARNGDFVLVERLIRAGADIKLRTRRGQSALDIARSNGHNKIEAYLMKQYER